ncbi:MAG: helix-turn-helix domain-containing protein, partial [bacterium]|nr:helix-turn-helix domain-containing protein [bacterium]
ESHGKKVFISFTEEAADFVERLKQDLKSAGLTVLERDNDAAASAFLPRKIEESISGSDFFLMLMSKTRSQWQLEEYGAAAKSQLQPDSKLEIFFLLRDGIELPKPLKDAKCINFAGGYESGLRELLESLEVGIVSDQQSEVIPIPLSKIKITPENKEFMCEFKTLMENKLSDENLDLDAISKKLSIGRSTIFRRMNEMGTTPHQYILSFKLDKAAQLLKKKTRSIAQIALDLGFANYNHFSTIFKKRYGDTPRDFIKINEQAPPDQIMPHGFSIDYFDQALIALGAKTLMEKIFFSDKTGTPQREYIFSQVMDLYYSNRIMIEEFRHFAKPELIQKIRETIFNLRNDIKRSGGIIDDLLEFYRLTEVPIIREHARSVAAIFMKEDITPGGGDFNNLRVKPYGQTFNLNVSEPYLHQPIAAGRMGTGVLVADDVVVTAAHIADEINVSQLRFAFDFVMSDEHSPVTEFPDDSIYSGVEILGRAHNPYADWALVKLDRNVSGRSAVPVSSKNVYYEQPIALLANPCGLPLKYATGFRISEVTPRCFKSVLNLYGGSNGSPVFCAESNELIGIVSRPVASDFRWTGKDWVSLSFARRDADNSGSRCTKVCEFINHIKP